QDHDLFFQTDVPAADSHPIFLHFVQASSRPDRPWASSARSFCAPRKPTCHSLSSGCTSPTGSRVDEYGDSVERLGQSDGCCCRPAEVGGSSPGAETRPARIRLPAPAASAGIVAPLGGTGWFPGRFLQVAPRLPRRFLQVEPPHGDSPWPGADRLRS